MTYEEAIKILELMRPVPSRGNGKSFLSLSKNVAIDSAIEALEKQIPKKVDTGKSRIFGCKLCGYGMDDVYIDDEWNYPIEPMFCPFCGQAIDWSDDE